MTGLTPPRKPPVGSRTPTSRPRRVAGGVPVLPPVEPVVEPADQVGEPEPEVAPDPPAGPGRRPSSRLRLVLAAVVVVLLAVGGVELAAVLRHDSPADRPAGAVTGTNPVQLDELSVRSVVDQAGQAAVLIASASATDYDAGVEKAAATMTDPFAEEYRATKGDVKDQVVAQQAEITAQVDAAGIVTAGPTEAEVLVFVTQSTVAGTGPVTPRQYREIVTMVKTDDGWLVADVDAGDLVDATGADTDDTDDTDGTVAPD